MRSLWIVAIASLLTLPSQACDGWVANILAEPKGSVFDNFEFGPIGSATYRSPSVCADYNNNCDRLYAWVSAGAGSDQTNNRWAYVTLEVTIDANNCPTGYVNVTDNLANNYNWKPGSCELFVTTNLAIVSDALLPSGAVVNYPTMATFFDPAKTVCDPLWRTAVLRLVCNFAVGGQGGGCNSLNQITNAPTSASPITNGPTTFGPTTRSPSTSSPITNGPTTRSPTTDSPTTNSPTTNSPTTNSPTTNSPTTNSPTTNSPTTNSPSTSSPTTNSPTTDSPTTSSPTTNSPTTNSPTTNSPTTDSPTTDSPTTDSPTTDSPTTSSPTTNSPTTDSPTTDSPTTDSPTTSSPTTNSPTTDSPTTNSPTTDSPTTDSPTTDSPTTDSPTTDSPTTNSPTTDSPTTNSPTTDSPTTDSPTTDSPTTDSPTTDSPTTNSPTTASPTTRSPTTNSPTVAPTAVSSGTAFSNLTNPLRATGLYNPLVRCFPRSRWGWYGAYSATRCNGAFSLTAPVIYRLLEGASNCRDGTWVGNVSIVATTFSPVASLRFNFAVGGGYYIEKVHIYFTNTNPTDPNNYVADSPGQYPIKADWTGMQRTQAQVDVPCPLQHTGGTISYLIIHTSVLLPPV